LFLAGLPVNPTGNSDLDDASVPDSSFFVGFVVFVSFPIATIRRQAFLSAP